MSAGHINTDWYNRDRGLGTVTVRFPLVEGFTPHENGVFGSFWISEELKKLIGKERSGKKRKREIHSRRLSNGDVQYAIGRVGEDPWTEE
jgi:hypothetical protein